MPHFGFVRVATGVPILRVADCRFNAEHTLTLLKQAGERDVAIAAFPELGLTGYTCNDLFHQPTLQRAAMAALEELATSAARVFRGLAIVGLPVLVDNQVFNCAALFSRGKILGIVPKSYLPNYREFYEGRYFAAAATAQSDFIVSPSGKTIPFGTDLLFDASGFDGLIVGVEICEDVWVPVPPSCFQAIAGATLLFNLSASNELIGKAGYRRQLVTNQSAQCMAAYIYAGCGVHESTTDLVFGGHCLMAENGWLLAESQRFQRDDQLLVGDIDVDRLRLERSRTTTFAEAKIYAPNPKPFRRILFEPDIKSPRPLARPIDPHPFVPRASSELQERCEDIFNTQVAGLAKRLEHIGSPNVAIGVSGGLDSTLALLVTCKTFDLIKQPRNKILGFTMPGFGTTARTKNNAHALMKQLGITAKEIDIRPLCLAEWQALGHKPFGIDLVGLDVDGLNAKLRNVPADRRQDLVFENVQARVRTNLLMNSAFVIGTGDLSESALGWCTYNGDHMSMYGVNVSIPKTLVRFLVEWAAGHEFQGDPQETLRDIVATVISPELLPTNAKGESGQSTEDIVGPYELHDFFLYHVLRAGAPPDKILFLANQAKFDKDYSAEEIKRWLIVFIKRFFANQFKRSCLPDGPKVGSVSLSPRGDWRMPSDASAAMWLERVEGGE